MIRIIAVITAVFIAVVLVLAAAKPDAFRIERSATIKAPPTKIYSLINDFHNWSSWSPWAKMDPDMKQSHSGAYNGKGAVYEWNGNKKVGQGRMEITDSVPPSKVVIKLDFLKPFEGHNVAEFTLQAQNGATVVDWAMTGHSAFIMRVMCLFMDMDKMVGKDFEAGLANMKGIAEK